MSKVKFKLNRAGVRELLKSVEMQSIINDHTMRVLNTAGPEKGYEANVMQGKNRVSGRVYAATIQAKRSNAKQNTLLKALKA